MSLLVPQQWAQTQIILTHNDAQQVNNEDKYFRERILFSRLGDED